MFKFKPCKHEWQFIKNISARDLAFQAQWELFGNSGDSKGLEVVTDFIYKKKKEYFFTKDVCIKCESIHDPGQDVLKRNKEKIIALFLSTQENVKKREFIFRKYSQEKLKFMEEDEKKWFKDFMRAFKSL